MFDKPGYARRAATALLLATCLLVGGCAANGEPAPSGAAPTTGNTVATPTTSASPQATATVPAALAFSAPKVGGGQFEGASLSGKPAIIWFWAAWCPRCRAKADNIKDVHANHGAQVNVVGVAGLGSGDAAMAQFVSQYGLGSFTNLADDQGVVWRHFGVTEQEYFVLIDRAGAVVHKGPLSDDELRQRAAAFAG